MSNGDSSSHSPWTTRAAVIAAVATAIATLIASIGALYYNGQASQQATEQAHQATEQAQRQFQQAQAAQRQVRVAQRQVRVAQTSERFSRSVEQLGSKTPAVRIGAAYSFGRLMRDSRLDQQVITRILSSFIRAQARQARAVPNGQKYRLTPLDILAALTVLDAQPRPRSHTSPDGTDVTWPSMYLYGVDLRRFALKFAFMREASLRAAMLSGANLHGTRLDGADLRGAHLDGADLTHANLTGAKLHGAHLDGADLSSARNLTGSQLVGVTCSPSTKWPKDLTPLPKCAAR